MLPLTPSKPVTLGGRYVLQKLRTVILIVMLQAAAFMTTVSAYAQDAGPSSASKIQSLLTELNELPPEDLDMRTKKSLFLVYAYEEAGELERARELAKSMTPLLDAQIDERVKSYALYRILLAYAKEGDYEKTFELLDNYRESATDDVRLARRYTTVRALAEIYENLSYYERSAAIIEEAMTTPEYQDLSLFKADLVLNNVLLANQYNQLGNPELAYLNAMTARKELDIFVKERPDANAVVLSIMAMRVERAKIESLINMGEEQAALIKLEPFTQQTLELDRRAEYLEALTNKAKIYRKMSRLDEAQALLKSVVSSDAFDLTAYKSADTLGDYAAILAALKRPDEAVYYYKKAQDLRKKLTRERTGLRAAFVDAKIDNAARQEQLDKLEVQNTIANASVRRSKVIAGLSLLTAILALMAMIGFYRSWKILKHGRLKLHNYAKDLKRSEAKAKENAVKAEAASEAKTAFLANMSHEIRTPMNGVLGMAQVLKGTGLNSSQEECVDIIETSGEALLTIINDILDFSKIEAGKLELDPTPSCLRRSVEDVTTMLATSASDKGIELLVRFAPDVPVDIIADIGRIRQILINLISNAVKFTESGYVLVNISGRQKDDTAHLNFEIFDTGIGVTPEKLNVIFDAFNQAENSTTRRFGGTGLGLSITERLIEAMGGELKVKSQIGKGSNFHFALSFPSHDQKLDMRCAPMAMPHKSALLVSSFALSRKILTDDCTAWSMRVKGCAKGLSAIAELRAAQQNGQPYSAVIFEDNLPDMSAQDFVSAARRLGHSRAVKLIFLSRALSNSERQDFTQLGVESFVMKPQKQSALFSALSADAPEAVQADAAYKSIGLAS